MQCLGGDTWSASEEGHYHKCKREEELGRSGKLNCDSVASLGIGVGNFHKETRKSLMTVYQRITQLFSFGFLYWVAQQKYIFCSLAF